MAQLQTILASLGVVDWIFGIGALSLLIALLVLMRTRLGQGSLVTKCLVLSVFAHVLLAVFVIYRFQWERPGLGLGIGKRAVKVRIAAASEFPSIDTPPDPQAVTPEPAPVISDAPTEAPKPDEPAPNPSQEVSPEPMANAAPADSVSEIPNQIDAATAPAEIVAPAPPVESPPNESISPIATETKVEHPADEDHASDSIEKSTPLPWRDGAPSGNSEPRKKQAENSSVVTPYQARSGAEREARVEEFGGDPTTESSVEGALEWLKQNQHEDGRWSSRESDGGRRSPFVAGNHTAKTGAYADVGISALATLAFLGRGETHKSGAYQTTVADGIQFLLESQDRDGAIVGQSQGFERMYCHGMATLAIGEAYGMTHDAELEAPLRRAIAYSLRSQHPRGGWRYRPWREQDSADIGDMSQFGWQLMAIKSGAVSGMPMGDNTRASMEAFIDACSSRRNRGLASYRPGERVSRTMTAESYVCRRLLSYPLDSASEREAMKYLLESLPGAEERDIYYWYYGTLATFLHQGETWEIWNTALKRELLELQRVEGRLAGSWDPDRMWGAQGGRVYQTALSALCLEVYYRYVPAHEDSALAKRRKGITK